jgi:tRNA pseudouridine38-40 synthase
MVRAIVGTMIQVGNKKINLKNFEEILISQDRTKAGPSAPAHALYLSNIEYPKEIFANE